MYKTTKADFEEFKAEAEYWIDYFGLKDWEVHFRHEFREDAGASHLKNYEGKISTIYLSTKWNNPPHEFEIKKCAFHEVCELLLCQLHGLACGFHAVIVVNEYTHEIIRRLENSIFKEKL